MCKKLITRSWILLGLDGRTVLVVNKLFSDAVETRSTTTIHFRLITKKSLNRVNNILRTYNADFTQAVIDKDTLTSSLNWSTMRHYNGVMLSSLDYMNALAQDNPVEFFSL